MPPWTDSQQSAIETLARDLERVFGARLESLVAYAGQDGDETVHSLALIEGLTFRDLAACLPLADMWHRRDVAVPLMLSQSELSRTLDIFPLEYAAIVSTHVVVRGRNPFAGIRIPTEDLRRACEAQAKSQLIHLREAFLESHGDAGAVSRLIVRSAAPFRALLANIARLPDQGKPPAEAGTALSDDSLAQMAERDMGVPAPLVREVLSSSRTGPSTVTDPTALLARYIDAAQQVWDYVDRWR
jgi:hypothetical protein